jgi:hypothetical protein
MNSGAQEPDPPTPPAKGPTADDAQRLEQQLTMPSPRPAAMPVQEISFWTPRTICAAITRLLLRSWRGRR